MSSKKNDHEGNANHILKIFNFVGGALIFFGIAYFIQTNWHTLNDFLKIFTTLGAAIAAFIVGVLLAGDEKYSAGSSAFFMIAGLTLPFGLSITIDLANLFNNIEMVRVVISGTCLLLFLAANYYLQRDILRLFCVFYASYFFIALTSLIFDQALHSTYKHLYDYQMLALGLSYFIGGRYLQATRNALTGPLYFFGSLFILTTSFDLGGLLFSPGPGNESWKIISPILVMLSFVLAVPLRSKSLLYVGALFLVIYLASMTSLFAQLFGSVGWPLLLIVAGLFLMVFGYVLVTIHRKITG
jgi:hypothetical protein